MPYYTGTATSYANLASVLTSTLIGNGWVSSDGILSKGDMFIKLTTNESFVSANAPEGLIAQGGTGQTGATLLDASLIRPRLGRPRDNVGAVTWPIEYFIHVLTGPDEVYLVVRYNVNLFTFMSFGKSTVPNIGGTGLWITGSNNFSEHSAFSYAYNLKPTTGGVDYSYSYHYPTSPGAPFWETEWASTYADAHADYRSATVHANLMSYPQKWLGHRTVSSEGTRINAVAYAAPLISRLPSAWNAEATLVPIQVYATVGSLKVSLVVDVAHARYTRVDNYEPGQVISIGPDRWKIYPFVSKNTADRDCSNLSSSSPPQSGTLGWAIRYDGV
jgi:hypothetical protein